MISQARLAAVVGIAVAVLSVSTALADGTFTDPTGDAKSAADITGVAVTNDAEGNVTLAITYAGGQPLTADQSLFLDFDTDQNADTGGPSGQEVTVYFEGNPQSPRLGGWNYGHWNGTKIDYEVIGRTGKATFKPGELDFTINSSELDDATTFGFWINSVHYTDNTADDDDFAPDGSDVYTYTLPSHTVVIYTYRPYGTPVLAEPGKRFTVVMPVKRADSAPVRTATVGCVVRVGGRGSQPERSFRMARAAAGSRSRSARQARFSEARSPSLLPSGRRQRRSRSRSARSHAKGLGRAWATQGSRYVNLRGRSDGVRRGTSSRGGPARPGSTR